MFSISSKAFYVAVRRSEIIRLNLIWIIPAKENHAARQSHLVNTLS